MRLEGKRALLVGAATGIGRMTAQMFAREGAAVVIGDMNESGAKETVSLIEGEGGRASFISVDVRDEDQVQHLVDAAAERLGGLNILVNNAGVQRSGLVDDVDASTWDLVLDVNIRGMFFTIKHAVKHLRQQGGAIVNTSSVAGIKGGRGLSVYSASKGAVIAFTVALADELAQDNIRVNCVCPGWIDTPFNQPAIDFMGGPDQQRRLIESKVPMKRQGRESEIAPGILYLASDEASYMTGRALVIDGGMS